MNALTWLGLYGVLVVWCTWPLGAHLTTHLPDPNSLARFDLRQMIWALSWQTHILTTAPSRFFEANVYHPTPHALLYADAGYGALPFFMPAMLATGNPILASNVMFLTSITLTVWGMHVLIRRWTGSDAAAFVAAGTLLTSRWLLWRWGPTAPNYVVLQYYPPIIALAASERLSGWRVGLLAMLVALQGVVSPYVAVPVLATLGVLAGWRLLWPGALRKARPLLVALVSGAVVIAIAYLPNLWWLRHLEPELARQSWWRALRGIQADLPFGGFVGVATPTTIAIPLLAIAACGIGMRLVRSGPRPAGETIAWRHGLLWTGVGLALMVTPRVMVFGHPLTLPHALLMDRWPGLDLLRSTERLGVGGLFGLAILAGVGFTEIAAWLPRFMRVVLAVVLVGAGGQGWADMARFAPVPTAEALAKTVSLPQAVLLHDVLRELQATMWGPLGPWRSFPVADATIRNSPVRDALRQPGGPLVVIEVGPELRRGAKLLPTSQQVSAERHRVNAQAMFESIGHWRPVLNGYGGFYPKDYPARMRLARALPDPAALRQLRVATGVELILVRGEQDHAGMQAWEHLAQRGVGDGLVLVARAGDELLFRVTRD